MTTVYRHTAVLFVSIFLAVFLWGSTIAAVANDAVPVAEFDAGNATDIDLAKALVQYTTANCGAFTLRNAAPGTTYFLVVKGTGGGVCTFRHAGLRVKTAAILVSQPGEETAVSIVRAGDSLFIAGVSGLK
jgi:hypothetical protein